MKFTAANSLCVIALLLGFFPSCNGAQTQHNALTSQTIAPTENSQSSDTSTELLWNEWIAVIDDSSGASAEACATAIKRQGIFVSEVFESLKIIVMITKQKDEAIFAGINCIRSVEFSGVVDISGIAGISN